MDLTRFVKAQQQDFLDALREIRQGKKRSHWMWYIFPQLTGLGRSPVAEYYAIKNLEEAKEYLKDDYLRENLLSISNALLGAKSGNAAEIFGFPDYLKLHSSMTLFSIAGPEYEVFGQVLEKFFQGKRDENTLRILEKQQRKE